MVQLEVNMGFGRNPHVAKAEAAEQKALAARDDSAREQAWREAARRWDRAAERETDDKRRQQYSDRAETARKTADDSDPQAEPAAAPARTLDKTSN
jgi:hypothetical protein